VLVFAAIVALSQFPQPRLFPQPDLGRVGSGNGAGGDAVCPPLDQTCSAANNLLSDTSDFTGASWSTFSPGTTITVSAATTASIDGQTVPTNRVQFGAVAGGQEASLYQNFGSCKKITCTYSIYLRSHSGASVPTGNLPIATAELGGDGQGYQLCPFTSNWSRCVLTVPSQPAAGFAFFWIGYVASQSGTSAALDIDLAGPKAEYGVGGATAFQCPSPLQDAGFLVHTGYVQGLVAADWGIIPRDGASLVKTSDNTLVLMGGWKGTPQSEWSNDGGSNVTTNQVWKSTDNGATWTAVLAHVDDPPQSGDGGRWRRRHSHCSFITTIGGTDYIYVIGGDGFDSYYNNTGDGSPPYPADVWRSPASTYGATWERMTATAGWGGTGFASDGGLKSRTLLSCWADGSGNIFVGGGQSDLTVSSALNDIWESTDAGSGFSSLGNAPWGARGTIANSLPHFNNKTWLYGGEVYDTDQGSRLYFNDVWGFNDPISSGSVWTRSTRDAGFTARGYLNALAWNSRLWMLKGYDGANSNEVWSSSDGACWRHERAVAGAAEHAASAVISMDAGAAIITGSSTSTNVWKISAP
jgi:hypothetical protein